VKEEVIVVQDLQDIRKLARELGLYVPLDFTRDVYLFGAAVFFLEWVAIAGDKDFLLQSTRVMIPDKVRRRSPRDVARYLLDRWPKPAVKEPLSEILLKMISDEDISGRLKRYPLPIIWLCAKAEGKECSLSVSGDLAVWVKEAYECTVLLYHIKQVMQNPLRLKEVSLDRKYRDEIARLSRKVDTAAAVAAQRHREAEAAKQEKQVLETSLGSMFREYEERIQLLERENEALKRQLQPRPLAGKVVCVVGAPGRVEGYRRAITERGAELRFVDGLDGQGEAGQAVAASDAVILDIGYAHHKTTVAAKKKVDKLGLPVVVAPISGMGAFDEALDILERRVSKRRELGI